MNEGKGPSMIEMTDSAVKRVVYSRSVPLTAVYTPKVSRREKPLTESALFREHHRVSDIEVILSRIRRRGEAMAYTQTQHRVDLNHAVFEDLVFRHHLHAARANAPRLLDEPAHRADAPFRGFERKSLAVRQPFAERDRDADAGERQEEKTNENKVHGLEQKLGPNADNDDARCCLGEYPRHEHGLGDIHAR